MTVTGGDDYKQEETVSDFDKVDRDSPGFWHYLEPSFLPFLLSLELNMAPLFKRWEGMASLYTVF